MIPTKEELEKEALPLREKTIAEAEEAVYKQVLEAQVGKLSTVDVVPPKNLPAWAMKEVVSKYRDLGYRVFEYGEVRSYYYTFTIVLNETQWEEERREAERYTIVPDKKWWQFWK